MKFRFLSLCLSLVLGVGSNPIIILPVRAENSSAETVLHYQETPISLFRVENTSPGTDSALDYTDWFYSKWEDCHYIFLPSTADRSKLTISYEADGNEVSLSGQPVVSDEVSSLLSTADEFDVSVDGKDCGKLKILQSNLGCIYVSTSSGGFDDLDLNSWKTETGSSLMVDADGKIIYDGEVEKITRHGNSSWDYSDKKPYNFKLPKKTNLFGMGKAKKWALISNCNDHSKMRNYVTNEICRNAGVDYIADCVFVDLYADGSYRGTYQLSERVQIQKNRVDIIDLEEETEKLNEKELDSYPHIVKGAKSTLEYIENSYKYYDIPNVPDDITGGYLLQFQLYNRYGIKADSGFVTSRGLAVQVDGPEYASEAQILYIRQFVQELEDAIYSKSGYNSKGKHYSDYLDVDSFIKAVLMQEIGKNIDGEDTSFFLWKDSDSKGDGKLHCSPVWDFDLAYGTFNKIAQNSEGNTCYSWDEKGLFTTCSPISGYDTDLTDNSGSNRPTVGVNWAGMLIKQKSFKRRMAEIYFECFEDYLKQLTEGDKPLISQMAAAIKPSVTMDNARWHSYGGAAYLRLGRSSGKDYEESVDLVRTFISKRTIWLSDFFAKELVASGDVNDDGAFTIADIVLFEKWLVNDYDRLYDWQAGDFDNNKILDSFDLVLMRKALIAKKK